MKDSFSSLVDLFLWRVSISPGKPALGSKKEGKFRFISWEEFLAEVKKITLFLYQQRVQRGDRVGILSENRPEWAIADLAILSLGAATVPLYPTSSVKECLYILEHAQISHLFVSNLDQCEKIRSLIESGALESVTVFDLKERSGPKIFSWAEAREKGRLGTLNQETFYGQSAGRVGEQDIATVIYTSGTTGPPKGVMLTHANFLSNCLAAYQVLPLTDKEVSLSFLPLSHVFERMAGYYFMIRQGAQIAYAENMQTVPEDLQQVKPTVAASVPRLYEKMFAKIMETVQAGSPVKQKLFHWAIGVGKQAGEFRQSHRPLPFPLSFQFLLARILVFKKLKQKLGGRIKFFISGGAPLAKELGEFFYAADVLILEGYGLTETSPVISVNRPDKFKFGTVGLPLPGVEVKIAPDGEILTRGPHVMKGYFQNDDATREAIRDGWFSTGDLGEIDAEGFLRITGRKKDLIITAGGKNISPQNIENEILCDCLFSQVVVLGDRKPFLVALIALNRIEAQRLALERGMAAVPWDDLLEDERMNGIVHERLALRMKDFAPYEQIKYFHLLPKEFSQDAGEMTPTMKVKRKVVMERYSALIESLYQKGRPAAKAVCD